MIFSQFEKLIGCNQLIPVLALLQSLYYRIMQQVRRFQRLNAILMTIGVTQVTKRGGGGGRENEFVFNLLSSFAIRQITNPLICLSKGLRLHAFSHVNQRHLKRCISLS